MKTKQNMVECSVGEGRKDDGGDGRRKIIWRKFRCKHTKEFQSESLQKLFTKSASQPERVGMCLSVYFRVCVCVFASVLGVCQCVFAKKKVRSARGHQLASALTWSKTTETRANGCHHQHCCYCCCCYCFFYCCCHCNVFFPRLA